MMGLGDVALFIIELSGGGEEYCINMSLIP
jgi:hypothetical protein